MSDGDLFTDETDPIWDEPAVTRPKAGKPERVRGDFYLCPKTWADKAAEVAGQYLILALRLYRRWRMRKPGTDVIAVTARALAGSRNSRYARLCVVARLAEAGLIEIVVEGGRGRAPRVRIIDPQQS
jgi:hypothetical protein